LLDWKKGIVKYLCENEVGFDSTMLGFPSIQGCQAIVYQTSAGIYGFHSFGGSDKNSWQPRAMKLREFIESLGALTPATRLYGCSFVSNNQRGYTGSSTAGWRQELVRYADMLGYHGKISGYDLSKTLTGASDSAYVEYRINAKKCDVYIRKWDQFGSDANIKYPKVGNTTPTEHRRLKSNKTGDTFTAVLADLEKGVVISPTVGVDRNNLIKVSKQSLR
jgi:hypothetical protein